MKKEGPISMQDVEKKYGFDKCEKSEFANQMIKEFMKLEKKLAKVSNFEKMKKEGKELNEEMIQVIGKKQEFIDHIKQLRKITDIYVKVSPSRSEESKEPTIQEVKIEAEKKAAEARNEELKRLSQFFIVAEMIKEKDHISPTPLAKVPKEKQEEILNYYNKIVKLTRGKDITMTEEAEKIMMAVQELLRKDDQAKYIARVMGNPSISEIKFKIEEGPEHEFVMLQPANKLEMSDQINNEPTQEKPVQEKSVEKPQVKKEQRKEEVKKVVKPQTQEDPKKEERKKPPRKYPDFNNDKYERRNPRKKPHQDKDKDDDGEFEIAMSKADKREMMIKRRGRGHRKGYRARENFRATEAHAENDPHDYVEEDYDEVPSRSRGGLKGRGKRYGKAPAIRDE